MRVWAAVAASTLFCVVIFLAAAARELSFAGVIQETKGGDAGFFEQSGVVNLASQDESVFPGLYERARVFIDGRGEFQSGRIWQTAGRNDVSDLGGFDLWQRDSADFDFIGGGAPDAALHGPNLANGATEIAKLEENKWRVVKDSVRVAVGYKYPWSLQVSEGSLGNLSGAPISNPKEDARKSQNASKYGRPHSGAVPPPDIVFAITLGAAIGWLIVWWAGVFDRKNRIDENEDD